MNGTESAPVAAKQPGVHLRRIGREPRRGPRATAETRPYDGWRPGQTSAGERIPVACQPGRGPPIVEILYIRWRDPVTIVRRGEYGFDERFLGYSRILPAKRLKLVGKVYRLKNRGSA